MLSSRPFPDLGETFQSYVIRLARFNHYKLDHWTLYLSRESVPYRSKDIAERNLLRQFVFLSTGMPSVNQLFDQWQFFDTEKKYFDYKAIKVCPACFVSNKNKLLAEWSVRFNVVCSEHECLLVDSCSNCGDLITERAIHALKCSKCELPIKDFRSNVVKIDSFSKKIHKLFGKGLINKRDTLINELSWQHLHLEAYSSLVYQEGSRLWRSKQNYSIEQKYAYQKAVGQLLENAELLNEALCMHLSSQIANGNLVLGKAFTRLNRYLKDNRCPTLVVGIKTLIKEFEFEENQTVGLVWLSNLYGIESQELKKSIYQEFESVLFKNRGILAINAYEVINAYFNHKNHS